MLPLHRLFTALQAAGLFIGPAERLRVQQLLADNPAAWQTAEGRAALLYELAPLLCRNRVEQEAFYKAYQAFLEELAVPVEIQEEELVKKPTFWKKYGKVLAWALGLLGLLLVIWWATPRKKFVFKIPEIEIQNDYKGRLSFAPGDKVVFVNNTYIKDTANHDYIWFVNEQGGQGAKTIFKDTTFQLNYIAPMPRDGKRANYEAILNITDRQTGKVIHDIVDYFFEVTNYCSNPPVFKDSIHIEGILRFGETLRCSPPKDLPKRVVAEWTFTEVTRRDSIIRARNTLYKPKNTGPLTITLTITDTTQTGYCTTTLTKEIFIQEDLPTLAALPLYKDEVKPLWAYTWLTIAIALLAFALAVWFAWRWWHRPSITIPPPAPKIPDALRRAFETEPADKTPYSIPHRSNNSQIRIAAEQIELANTFRRRQEGQVALLNIPRSINATMEKLGYAELRFSYNTRPTHYLFLIDLQNEVSHQAQLFRYLVEMLEGQDVLADVFFYKNSLSRCWNNLRPEGLALDQLALQYADRRLVVFGDGYRLLSETDEDGVLHKEPAEALRRWPQRMLLTPAPVAAWTYREARLYQLWAVFHADLGGLMQAARFVEAGMDDENLPPTFAEWKRQCQRSAIDADTDRDWDTPAEHRDYLREANDRDGALYRWLRALSVYPELNWNVTIAIGRALGIDVRYEHLLVLARIPWLQSGAMKPSLWRAWMREMPLPGVEPDETLAREAVRAELRAVEALCAEGYADQQMQTRLAVQDFALAPTDRDAQDRLYYILQHIAPAPLLTEELDRTVQRNIPDFQWTGGEKPGRALAYLRAGQPQPTVQRPFWTRDLLRCALCWPFFLLPLLVAPKHWAGLHERYPTAIGLFVVPQEDEAVRLNNLVVRYWENKKEYAPSYILNSQQNINIALKVALSKPTDTVFAEKFPELSLKVALNIKPTYKLAASNLARVYYSYGVYHLNDKKQTGRVFIDSLGREIQKTHLQLAIEFFRLAQANDSLSFKGAEGLAIAYYQNNQPDSACFWMGQVLALKPDYRNWLAEKGVCQTDKDGDGVLDIHDKCPEIAGKRIFDGCPEAQIVGNITTENLPGVVKEVISVECFDRKLNTRLDTIFKKMLLDQQINLTIVGYVTVPTDGNLEGLDNQVKQIKKKLVSSGIVSTRISTKATSEDDPSEVEDKNTVGKCRIEFSLKYPQEAPSVTVPADRDGDGVPAPIDGCPDDPAKTAPGPCGCGKPDTDSDGDGISDCHDKCPDEKGIKEYDGCPTFSPSSKKLRNDSITLLKKSIFSPIILYFNNDEPDKRTMKTTTNIDYAGTYFTYIASKQSVIDEYTKGLVGPDIKRATDEIDLFFEQDVKGGWNKLKDFSLSLYDMLEQGDRVELTLKGYSSPRGASNYNMALSSRRISSVLNHFLFFDAGIYKKFIDSGQLTIILEPNGEFKSPLGISDNIDDPRNSVFGISARRENRVEIIVTKIH